jgi:hypothetical protein
MQYKVIPFASNVKRDGNISDVARQLQTVIDSNTIDGWQYQRMENVVTFVDGTKGCFGFGALPGNNVSFQMLVFVKQA